MLGEISETKSKWFGESEKRIKAVFDRYHGLVKEKGIAPILLFNEADAVLGKRRELTQSRLGPDQTENAIQNIILQEMENLNGILIATTNMTVNLDKVFERRFLYKIEFDKPDTEAKK
jgi:SpoVK/Ycf46/Vps4 family AAA+-type ATPase